MGRFVRGTCVDCGNAAHECECDDDEAWGVAMAAKVTGEDPWLLVLADLVAAARRVENHWPEAPDRPNYPEGLPSWDEFVNRLEAWHDAERRERNGRT